MSEDSISTYPVPLVSELPEDLQQLIRDMHEKAGFIPNVCLALAHRPDELRAFFQYHDTIMLRDSGLSKAEKEMIVVATSSNNNCLYCVVAHGAILRVYAKDSLLADQIATNYRKADISSRQKAMLDFAIKVADAAHEISPEDFEVLKGYGFSEDDIWDIAAITSFFGLSNRMANFVGIRPNKEFYILGRNIE